MKKSRRLLSMILAIAMIFTMMPVSLTASAASSYNISTAKDLVDFAKSVNTGDTNAISGKVTLKADIDLSGYDWVPIGSTQENAFLGTFDGNGYTISGINCTNGTTVNGTTTYTKGAYGLFGYVGDNDNGAATIENVIISNSTFTMGGKNVLCGAVAGCVVSKVGLTGLQTTESEVTQCGVTNTVTINAELTGGTNALGGVVGTFSGTFSECYSRANITLSTGSKNVNCHVGGVVGRADRIGATVTLTTKTEITDAYFAGTISSDSTSTKAYVGGVVGGSTDKDTLVESLVGIDLTGAEEPAISRVYSVGTLAAASAGGVAGYNCGGVFEDCYYHAGTASYAYLDDTDDGISSVAGSTFTDSLKTSDLKGGLLESNKFEDSSTSYPYPVLKNVADNCTKDDAVGSVYNQATIYDIATLKAVANHPDWFYTVTADISGTEDNLESYYNSLSNDKKVQISEKLGINDSGETKDVYTALTTAQKLLGYQESTTYYVEDTTSETGYRLATEADFSVTYSFKSDIDYYSEFSGDYAQIVKEYFEAGPDYGWYVKDETSETGYTLATEDDYNKTISFKSGTTYYTKSVVSIYNPVSLSDITSLTTTQQTKLIANGLATADDFSSSFDMTPIPSFNGSISGNGHTITGMTINFEDTDGTQTTAALFGTNYGKITNLSFKETEVSIDAQAYETVDGTYVAATVAAANYGTIDTVSTDATVTIKNGVVPASRTKISIIGGIAGYNYGTITSVTNTGVDLFKLADNAILDDSENQNYAAVEKKANIAVGGLVGINASDGTISGSSVNSARSELVGPSGVNVGTFCGLNNGEDTAVSGTTLANSQAASNFLAPYDPGDNYSTEDKTSTPSTDGITMGKGIALTKVAEVLPGSGQHYDMEQRVKVTVTDATLNKYNVTYFRWIQIAPEDITVTIDADKFNKDYYVTGKFSTAGISVVAYAGEEDERTLSKVSSADKNGYMVHIYTDAACTKEFTDSTFSVAGTYYLQLTYGDTILVTGVNTEENRAAGNKYIATFEVFDVKSATITSTNYDTYMAGQTPTIKVQGTMGNSGAKKLTLSQTKFPYDTYVDGVKGGTFSVNYKLTTDTEIDKDKIYYSDTKGTVVTEPKVEDIAKYYESVGSIYAVYEYDWYKEDGSGDLGTPNKTVTSDTATVNVVPSDIKVDNFKVTNSSDEKSETNCYYIDLSWESDIDDAKFVIYRKVAGAEDDTYKTLKTITDKEYTDTKTQPGTTYTYKVVMVIGGAESSGYVTADKLSPLPTSVIADVSNIRVPLNKDYNGKDGVNEVTATWANKTSTTLTYKDSSSESFDTLNYTTELDKEFDSSSVKNEFTATVKYMADGTNLTAVKSKADNTKDATYKIYIAAPTNISATTTYKNYPTGYAEGKFLSTLTVRAVYDYEADEENNIAAVFYQETISNKTNSNNIQLPKYDNSKGTGRKVTVSWECEGVTDAYTETVEVNFYDLLDPTVTATTGGTGENTVTWTAVDGASSYTVYRAVKPTGEDEIEYKKVTTVGNSETLEYVDEKAEEGVTYIYKVCTTIADMMSDGATAEVTTLSPTFIKLVKLDAKAKTNFKVGDEFSRPSSSRIEVMAYYFNPDATDDKYTLTKDTELVADKSYYVVDTESETGYALVATIDLNVADIATYYEKSTVAAVQSDSDFTDVENNDNYLSRELKYKATVASLKYQIDYSAFDGETVGTYNIKITYRDSATYKGHEIGNYNANVYDVYKLNVTTDAKVYELNATPTYTVKAVYGTEGNDVETVTLTSEEWSVATTPDMTTAGEKTAVIAYAADSTKTGSVTFTVYNPEVLTPAVDNLTRVEIPAEDEESDPTYVLMLDSEGTPKIKVKDFVNNYLLNDAEDITIYDPDTTEVIPNDSKDYIKEGYIFVLAGNTDRAVVEFNIAALSVITPYEDKGVTKTTEEISGTETNILVVTLSDKAGIDATTFLASDLENTTACLKVYKADGTTEVTSGKLATGYIVKLYAATDTDFETPIDTAVVVVKGDANGDGIVDISDIKKCVNHANAKSLLTTYYYLAGNVNGDKAIDISDIKKVVNFSLGKAVTF